MLQHRNIAPDQPVLDSIEDALADIAAGRMVIVVDDEDRENEGDLIMAADAVTPEAMAFVVRHTSGMVCVAMPLDRLEALDLPQMVPTNTEYMSTGFTITVDLKAGTTTGISAEDRAKTIRALADPRSVATDFNRPGHVFPLRAHPDGVFGRAGHTEAAIDLTRLAGRASAGLLCEIVSEQDGSMARLPELLEFGLRHGLRVVSIKDLVAWRQRHDGPAEAAPPSTRVDA